MSNRDARMNNTQSGRKTMATATSARPRVPNSRFDDVENRPAGSSSSNAPHQRSASGSLKPGVSHKSSQERRTERTTVTTRDRIQIRTKSPVKKAGRESPNGYSVPDDHLGQSNVHVRDNGSAQQRNLKKPLREYEQ